MTASVVEFRKPPKSARTVMDTLIVDLETLNKWRLPPFQRPLRVNDKVRAMAESLRQEGGMISGVITLGVIDGGTSAGTYLMDGQHRMEAFRLSGLSECLADVRICHFGDLSDMGQAFVELNSALVMMRPDDVLRGLEQAIPSLKLIREKCPFVGYDQIRRGENSPVLSVSLAIKTWAGSGAETPILGARSAVIAKEMSIELTSQLVAFLQIASAAWGRDYEYGRLWSALNLTLCMWLWRRLVLDKERGTARFVRLSPDQFKRCAMSLSSDRDYIDWLRARPMSERDRAPCYRRIKASFSSRLASDLHKKAQLPSPPWSNN